MKIVADDKIPFLRGVLEPFAEVVYLPGGALGASDVRDADGLIVRTRTLCDRALLGPEDRKLQDAEPPGAKGRESPGAPHPAATPDQWRNM